MAKESARYKVCCQDSHQHSAASKGSCHSLSAAVSSCLRRGKSKIIANRRCTCKLVVELSAYVIVLWYAHVHSFVYSKYGWARSGTLEFHEFQERAGWSATAELSYASPARSSHRSSRVKPKQCRGCLAHLPVRDPASILHRT